MKTFTTPIPLADCWATGAVSEGLSWDYWREGCEYAQVHWELGRDGGYDFMGVGRRTKRLLEVARADDKAIILCCTLAEVDGGTIRPISTFHDGMNREIADWGGPEAVGRLIADEARLLGVPIVKVLNEPFAWTEFVPLGDYERMLVSVFDRAPELRVIGAWHPSLSPRIARRLWRTEFHVFPRHDETTQQIVDGIAATAQAIKAKGGNPSLLEWVSGRAEWGPYSEQGAARFAAIVQAATNNDCGPLGVWWGGYSGSERLWTAPGWGHWALWLTSETHGLSRAFRQTFLEDDEPTLPTYREALKTAQRLAKRGKKNTEAALTQYTAKTIKRADQRLAEIIALEAGDDRPPPDSPEGVELLKALENAKAAAASRNHPGFAARYERRERGWTVDHRTIDPTTGRQVPHHGLAFYVTQADALEAYSDGMMPHD